MHYKNQLLIISTLTIAEMKARYRNTIAGIFWVMISPLSVFAVHGLIFKHVLKINVTSYYIFLLSGLLPWIFISSTITTTVSSFITMRDSLLSFQIHPISIIISKTIDSFINFFLPFLFLLVLLWEDVQIHPIGLAMIPIAFFILILGTTAICIGLATLQVFFRDTQYISNFIISVMLFLTPIFYPRHMIPSEYQVMVDFNPFFALIRMFKVTLWQFTYYDLYQALIHGLIACVIFIILSTIIWKKTRNELYINI